MKEEAFTITVSEFMNFPPTFGTSYPELESFSKLRKETVFSRLRRFNPLNLFIEASQRAVIKKAVSYFDDNSEPAEVFILGRSESGGNVISELIQKSLFKS